MTPDLQPGGSTQDQALDELVHWFQTLTPQSVSQLSRHYAPQIQFKDPFNEVQGQAAVQAIFEHMFEQLHEPRFVVRERILQGHRAFLTWDFLFRFKRYDTVSQQIIRGATYLEIDARGKVTLHRDYWDAAEELYEKLPWVGGLMRWLKARARS
jgi:ketosteroid isomerase-like protein